MPVFIVLEDRISKSINQFHAKETEPGIADKDNEGKLLANQQFVEEEKLVLDLISNTKAAWPVEYREEYYRLVNKVAYDAKIENVKDMTERMNSLKKLAMVISKVFFAVHEM